MRFNQDLKKIKECGCFLVVRNGLLTVLMENKEKCRHTRTLVGVVSGVDVNSGRKEGRNERRGGD